MKKLKVSLLAKVVIAIAAGVVFGQFLPGGIARIFVTFNSLFGNFLSFSIPLIILGLVTPAIGELGKGAGRLLALTALIAYGSTIFSGFFTYFSSSAIFPHILHEAVDLTDDDIPTVCPSLRPPYIHYLLFYLYNSRQRTSCLLQPIFCLVLGIKP